MNERERHAPHCLKVPSDLFRSLSALYSSSAFLASSFCRRTLATASSCLHAVWVDRVSRNNGKERRYECDQLTRVAGNRAETVAGVLEPHYRVAFLGEKRSSLLSRMMFF